MVPCCQDTTGSEPRSPDGVANPYLVFPSALAAGEYEVIATVLQDGAALNRLSKTYLVEDGPFLDLVKGLAFNHALPFGVLCVVIALFTGAVMGLVFKGGKGGH